MLDDTEGTEEVIEDSTEGEETEGESTEEQSEDEGEEQPEATAEESDEQESKGEEVEGDPKEEDDVDTQQMYRIKSNGEEFDVSLEDLVDNFQLKKASHDRFQQAAQREKEMDKFVEFVKENPLEGLKAMGMQGEGLRQFFYETAKQMLEEDGMPEEQKKALEQERELERYKQEAEERAQKDQTSQEQQAQEAAMKDYETKFTAALDSEAVPATPQAIQRMAQIMHTSLNNNYDMSVEQAAAYYKEEQAELIRSQLGNLSGDQITRILGQDAADKIRKNDIANVKNPAGKKDPAPAPKQKAPPKRSMSDWFDS